MKTFFVIATCLLAITIFAQESVPTPTEPAQEKTWTNDLFWEAARIGDDQAIEEALAAGIDINAKTQYQATALLYAIDRSHTSTVTLLLEKGADPNAKDSFYGITPMSSAVEKQNYEIVSLLLKHGAAGADLSLVSAVAAGNSEMATAVIRAQVASKHALAVARQLAEKSKSEKLLALFADLDIPPIDPSKLSAPSPDRYVGSYAGPNSMNMKISVEDGELKLSFGESNSNKLIFVEEHQFAMLGNQVTFEMDGDRAQRVRVNFLGNDLLFVPVAAPVEPATSDAETAKAAENNPPPKESRFGASSEKSRAGDLSVSSSNWPSFRGTAARGVADGQRPPTSWNVPENQNVKWKTAIPGLGHSGPVVWGNRVFVTTAVSDAADNSLRIGLYGDVDSIDDSARFNFNVYCLDKETGQILWEKTAREAVPAVKRHTKSTHANPTVATDGEHVIAFFASEGLFCYSVDGDLIWEKDLGKLDSGWFYDPGYQWGFGSSPIIFEDRVIVQCDIQKDSFVAALHIKNGEPLWRAAREEIPSWSTPTVYDDGQTAMLITHGTKAARAYDVRTGELLWTLRNHSEVVVPTPFVAHDLIFLASGYRPVQPIYAIRTDARGDITLADDNLTNEFIPWSTKRGGPYMATPISYGDYLYTCGNNGLLTCYQATTGEVVYKTRMTAPGGSLAFTASPIAGDGHLYFTAEDGRVLVVKAGPEFELVYTNVTGENILATPAISDGAMILRTEKSLIAVGL